MGITGGADVLSRRVQRLLGRLSRPDRFSRLHGHKYLRARKRLLRGREVEKGVASRQKKLSWRIGGDRRRRELHGTGAGYEQPIRRAVGYLAGSVFAVRQRRLSQTDLGQANRKNSYLCRRGR